MSRPVVWRACDVCGLEWPFPAGLETECEREHECQRCTAAALAALRRALDAAAAATPSGLPDYERRLNELFDEAFPTHHPALADYLALRGELWILRRGAAAEGHDGEATGPGRT